MNSKIERRGSGFVVNIEGDIVPTYAILWTNKDKGGTEMGLFDKKYCSVCGEKIGFLGNRKL